MLPDFPKIKERLQTEFTRFVDNMVRQEPLLSQIKRERHHEGNQMEIVTINGKEQKSSYKEISTGFSIKPEDVIKQGIKPFFENIQHIVEEMQKQQTALILSSLSEQLEKAGQTVNGKGKPFDFEIFLKVLGKIAIDFDDEGKPHLPSMVVSPDMAAKIKEELPKWEKNPDYHRRFEELIELKRKEWHD